MLQRAKIMWDDDLVIQRMSDEMEFAVTYSIPDVYFADELWISAVRGATGLSRPGTVPGGYLKLNPRVNSAALSLRGVRYWEDPIETVYSSGLG